jgi:hypothetical protein
MLSRFFPGRAFRSNLTSTVNQLQQEVRKMAENLSSEIQKLRASITGLTTVDQSVVALVQGFDARMDAAVAKALDAGATEEQLAAIREATAAITGEAATLAQAVVANTPAAPTAGAPAQPTTGDTIDAGAGAAPGDTSAPQAPTGDASAPQPPAAPAAPATS